MNKFPTSLRPGEARAAPVVPRLAAGEKRAKSSPASQAPDTGNCYHRSQPPLGEPEKVPTISSSVDRRKRPVKAQGAIEPREQQFGGSPSCPHCERSFSTFKGRRVHERVAHPDAFHSEAQQLDERKTKRRWNDEERRLIAEAEAAWTGPKTALLAHLCTVLPSRTKESIKGMRNKQVAVYQQFLMEARQRLGEPVVEDSVKKGQPPGHAKDPEEGGKAPKEGAEDPEEGGNASGGDAKTNTSKRGKRWTAVEHAIVAEAEAKYEGPKSNLYEALCAALPSRTKEAIKGMRLRSAPYKEALLKAREKIARTVTADARSSSPVQQPEASLVHPQNDQEESSITTAPEEEPVAAQAGPSWEAALERARREQEESSITTAPEEEPVAAQAGPSWEAALERAVTKEKHTLAHTCLSNRNRADRQFAKWLEKFTPTLSEKKVHHPPPEIKGNRAQRRRKLRAAWLGAYEKNPSRTAKQVLEGQSLHHRSTFPDGTTQFWRDLYESESVEWSEREAASPREVTTQQGLLRPFTQLEIKTFLRSMRVGAAGCDGIKLPTLRALEVSELCEWFNLFLLLGMLPRCLKRFRTTLIPKVQSPTLPSQYRPISVGSYVRRLFCGILAKRMAVIETHHLQKGFKPIEGCAVQSYTLRAIVDEYIGKNKSLSYAFMDVKKAFDSVSHHALRKAYIRADLPRGLIDLLEDMYVDNTTILSADPSQSIVKLRRGVLQGDPLSPILFNLIMDDVAAEATPHYAASLGGARVSSLLFADDAVLFGETPEGLQRNVTNFIERMAVYGLEVNAAKCAAVHIRADGRRKRWYIAKDVPLYAGQESIRSLNIGESYKYLGLRTSVKTGVSSAEKELRVMLGRLTSSVLKPQQRLAVLKINVIPKLLYETTLEFRSDCLLNDLDIRVRKEVRRWLHLPKDVPIPAFHAEVEDGGLGIQSLRTRVPRLQSDRFRRINQLEKPDPYVEALKSSPYWRKQQAETADSLARVGIVDKKTEREHWKIRLHTTVDGAGLTNHSNQSGYKSRWVADPSFLRLSGREFVGAIHVRCNSLYTRERATRGRESIKGRNCPCCPDKRESLAHILQVCWRSQNHRIYRHNVVVGAMANKFRKLGLEVTLEPRIPSGRSFLKPDIVAYNRKEDAVTIVDPSIVAVSRNLILAEADKVAKYDVPEVIKWATRKYGEQCEVRVFGMIMDWRGAWAPRSWKALTKMGVRGGFLETLSFRILKISKWVHGCIRNRTDA